MGSWLSFLSVPVLLGPVGLLCIARAANGHTTRALVWGLVAAGGINAALAIGTVGARWFVGPLTAPDALGSIRHVVSQQQLMALWDGVSMSLPVGFALTPEHLAVVCLCGGFAALHVLHAKPLTARARAVALLCCALCVVGIVLGRSAAGTLALLCGGVALCWWWRSEQGWRFVGPVVVVAAVVVLAVQRAMLLAQLDARVAVWQTSTRLLRHTGLFGVGFSRFSAAHAEQRLPGSALARDAMSPLVQWPIETGAIGVVLALAAVALWWRGRATDTTRSTCIDAGAVAALVFAALTNALEVGQTAALVAVLVGLALGGDLDAPMTPSAAPPARLAHALAVAAVALSATIVVVTAARESAVRQQNDAALSGAAPPADGYVALVAWDVDAQLAAAHARVNQLSTCAPPACEDAARDAMARLDALAGLEHPQGAVFVARAQLKARTDDTDGALDDVDRALDVDPGNASAHQLGVMLAGSLKEDVSARRADAMAFGVVVEVTAPLGH